MSILYTNLELSKKLYIPHTKIRRYSNIFLKRDGAENFVSSGVAREYTVEEAFILFIAHHLINSARYPVEYVLVILNNIRMLYESDLTTKVYITTGLNISKMEPLMHIDREGFLRKTIIIPEYKISKKEVYVPSTTILNLGELKFVFDKLIGG